MKYLDYLLTHAYDELPPQVQREISRTEYTERRELVRAVEPMGNDLPPVLIAAFGAATQGAGPQAVPERSRWVQGKVSKSKVRLPWLLAAAGWLLFAVMTATLLLRAPTERTVYQTVLADPPPPQVIVEKDTVYQTKYQSVIRYRTVHDTVVIEQPYPEYVTITDTLYLPLDTGAPEVVPVSGSRSLMGREEVTRFLVGAE